MMLPNYFLVLLLSLPILIESIPQKVVGGSRNQECVHDSNCGQEFRCKFGSCIPVCEFHGCGRGSNCGYANGQIMCSCPDNTQGNPLVQCSRITGCATDSQCGDNKLCEYGRCVNLCEFAQCGQGARCRVERRKSVCYCPANTEGNPIIECRNSQGSQGCSFHEQCANNMRCQSRICVNPCNILPCGKGAICQVSQRMPLCVCPANTQGDARFHCQPISANRVDVRQSDLNDGFQGDSSGGSQVGAIQGENQGDVLNSGVQGNNQGVGSQGGNQGVGAQGNNQGLGAQGGNQGVGTQSGNQGVGAQGSNQVVGAQGSSQGGGAQGSSQGVGAQGSSQGGGAQGNNQGVGAQGSNQGGGAQGNNQGGGAQGSSQGGGAQGNNQGGGAQGSNQGGGAQGNNQGVGAQGSNQGGGAQVGNQSSGLVGGLGCNDFSHCGVNENCKSEKCVDPCESIICGKGVECQLVQRQPKCPCSDGTLIDPNQQCQTTQGCRINSQCGSNKRCQSGSCVDPCDSVKCGLGAICQVSQRQPRCICPAGTEGNPREQCQPISDIQGCAKNSQCAENEQCDSGSCVNPCELFDSCGKGAKCQALGRNPQCICPANTQGDPFKQCDPVQASEVAFPGDKTTQIPPINVPGKGTRNPGCLNVPDPGECRGAFKRFYYNEKTDQCDCFLFGGCDVEGVKFTWVTFEECQSICLPGNKDQGPGCKRATLDEVTLFLEEQRRNRENIRG